MLEPPPSRVPRISRAALSFVGGWCVTVVVAVLVYFIWERADYARILNLSALAETTGERREVAVAIVSKTVVLLLPALLVGASLHMARPSVGLWVRSALFFVGLWLLLLDRSLHLSVGRHLVDLWAFRHVPHGTEAAGRASLWLFSALKTAAVSLFFAGGLHVFGARSEQWIAALLPEGRRLWLRALSQGGALLCVLLPFVPHGPSFFIDEGLRERLYGAMPLDVRFSEQLVAEDDTSPEGRLTARWRASYRRHFGALRNQTVRPTPEFPPGERPPIVLLVVESFRKDALTAERMPRLHAWAKSSAHVFQEHEAGTYSSESGMFSLLYGRNNLTYHDTLDAEVPPLLFTWLRSLNYELSYYTGHPIKWLRREEFLSERTVDRLVHDDTGTWPDWDRKALSSMVEHVRSSKVPTLSLVFLMSTHFEYQYPAAYERHTPVARSRFRITDVNAMGAEDRVPHFNRYKNSLAFVDDAIMNAIESLPDSALVVVVGDHGESFFEGGNYGHGFSFTDPVLDVPLLIRFPPGGHGRFASPRRVARRTLHEDVIGWLASYLGGNALFHHGYYGSQDWRVGRSAVLSTYADPGKARTYAMLSVPGASGEEIRARVTFMNDVPQLRLLGFEQEYGLPVEPPPLDETTVELLAETFERELSRLAR